MTRYRRKKEKLFENNEYMGAYADISFDIISETDTGKEALRFETKLHYYEKGAGEPLLLIHGIGQSLYTWRQNIDYFAEQGFCVIAPDMAGFGYSGHLNIYYTIEEYAIIIRAFLDAIDVKKTHIIGFSTGALSALCFAAAHPKRVGRMVLVSPGGPNPHYPLSLKLLSTRLGAFFFKHFSGESAVRSVLAEGYFDTTQLTDDVLAGYYDPYQNKQTRETLVRAMLHFDDTYARSVLKGIKKQILIFQGLDDRIHPEDVARAITTPLQHKRFVRLRNCAHFVHEEKADRFNEETLTFLREEKQPKTAENQPMVE